MNLIHIYRFTSRHVSGLHASHADRDLFALIHSRNDFHDSLQCLDVGVVYVAAAVVIRSGCRETVPEST